MMPGDTPAFSSTGVTLGGRRNLQTMDAKVEAASRVTGLTYVRGCGFYAPNPVTNLDKI
jgi:hypothetical protein